MKFLFHQLPFFGSTKEGLWHPQMLSVLLNTPLPILPSATPYVLGGPTRPVELYSTRLQGS